MAGDGRGQLPAVVDADDDGRELHASCGGNQPRRLVIRRAMMQLAVVAREPVAILRHRDRPQGETVHRNLRMTR